MNRIDVLPTLTCLSLLIGAFACGGPREEGAAPAVAPAERLSPEPPPEAEELPPNEGILPEGGLEKGEGGERPELVIETGTPPPTPPPERQLPVIDEFERKPPLEEDAPTTGAQPTPKGLRRAPPPEPAESDR